MKFSELKEKILAYANEQGDEFYPEEVAKKLGVNLERATKAMLALHKVGELVCADGCEKCDSQT